MFTVESCVRHYHIYKDIQDTTVGEELECARESDNPVDCYAAAMKKDGETVGDVLRKMSRLCTLFLEHNGLILCTVTGPKRHSTDLLRGGLELSCTLSSFTLESDARRADTFLLALSIACGLTVCNMGPLGSGRELVTEKYFNNAMITSNH